MVSEMNSKDVGDATVGSILAAFLHAGLAVLIPFGDNERYDLVVEENKRFYKIQCKTLRDTKKGAMAFSTCSSYAHRGRGRKNYKGEIDYFAAYSKALNKVYLVSVNDVGNTECTLRVFPTDNNQKENIRWAADYEFKGKINQNIAESTSQVHVASLIS